MKSLLLAVLLSAAAGIAAWVHGSPQLQHRDDTSAAITRYVSAEDNDFADLKGKLQRSNSSSAYFASLQALPGSNACVIYVNDDAGAHFGGCTFDAANLNDAGALYRRWLENVKSAVPQWRRIDLTRMPPGDVAATIFTDASQVHMIVVDIFNDPQLGYRVDTTFSKASVLRS